MHNSVFFVGFCFAKGGSLCDFLLAFLDNKTLPKGINFLKKEFVPRGTNSFLKKLTPLDMELLEKQQNWFA